MLRDPSSAVPRSVLVVEAGGEEGAVGTLGAVAHPLCGGPALLAVVEHLPVVGGST